MSLLPDLNAMACSFVSIVRQVAVVGCDDNTQKLCNIIVEILCDVGASRFKPEVRFEQSLDVCFARLYAASVQCTQ